MNKTIHQLFFSFPPNFKKIDQYPDFLSSIRLFKELNKDWEHVLWDEVMVEALILRHCPEMKAWYDNLKFSIQRLDVARLLICHFVGGVVSDLDIISREPLSAFIIDGSKVQVAEDWKPRAQCDFIYCPKGGFPGLLEALKENLIRVNNIPCYRQRKFRYVLETTGPRFLHRFLKTIPHIKQLWCTRTFCDPKFAHLSKFVPGSPLLAMHRTTWKTQLQ